MRVLIGREILRPDDLPILNAEDIHWNSLFLQTCFPWVLKFEFGSGAEKVLNMASVKTK